MNRPLPGFFMRTSKDSYIHKQPGLDMMQDAVDLAIISATRDSLAKCEVVVRNTI